MEIARWIFIGIGFIGTLFLMITSIVNFTICIKNKSFKHIVLNVQIMFMIGNLMFFIYGLGLTICNSDNTLLWNSVPTWAGNITPFILNTIMIIGKYKENKKTKAN